MRLLGNNQLTTNFDTDCPATREVLSRVGDKWSVLTVVILGGGPQRFNALRRSLTGISQRILTNTLRGLERDGIVTRTVFPTNPPTVEYALTVLGCALLEPITALAVWAQGHRAEVLAAREIFDQRVEENSASQDIDHDSTAKIL